MSRAATGLRRLPAERAGWGPTHLACGSCCCCCCLHSIGATVGFVAAARHEGNDRSVVSNARAIAMFLVVASVFFGPAGLLVVALALPVAFLAGSLVVWLLAVLSSGNANRPVQLATGGRLFGWTLAGTLAGLAAMWLLLAGLSGGHLHL